MFGRALESVVTLAATAAAAMLAVFAAGFALYALLETWFTPPASAAGVAAVAAAGAAIGAAVLRARSEHKRLKEAAEHSNGTGATFRRQAAAAFNAGPDEIADFLGKHPLVTLGVSALSGFLATRHPTLAGEIISALRGRPHR